MLSPVYFDHNATTALDPDVLEAMRPWLGLRFGNPSSPHEYGRRARAALDEARAQVAQAVGAQPSEVIFTSGGSEANNLFIKGSTALMKPARLAITTMEHPCVREPARQLVRLGWALDEIEVTGDGLVSMPDFEARLAQTDLRVVSVLMAHNETGVIQPIADCARYARQKGVMVHSDAVQALGKMPLNFRALGLDAMTLSAHKIGGPIGAGALVVDKRVELWPLMAGGGQEKGLRSGTENIAALVGFGVAAQKAVQAQAQFEAQLRPLRHRLCEALHAQGAVLFGEKAQNHLPNTVFFAFPGLEGETLVGRLDRAGFACASGSACSSAQGQPSRTLLAMGVPPSLARCAVRISLGVDNTAQQIDAFLEVLQTVRSDLHALCAPVEMLNTTDHLALSL